MASFAARLRSLRPAFAPTRFALAVALVALASCAFVVMQAPIGMASGADAALVQWVLECASSGALPRFVDCESVTRELH